MPQIEKLYIDILATYVEKMTSLVVIFEFNINSKVVQL